MILTFKGYHYDQEVQVCIDILTTRGLISGIKWIVELR